MKKLKGYIARYKLNKAIKQNKIPSNLRELHRAMKKAGIK